jgi:hypothetical protein
LHPIPLDHINHIISHEMEEREAEGWDEIELQAFYDGAHAGVAIALEMVASAYDMSEKGN